MHDLKRICVYCAASSGSNHTIREATRELGTLLVAEEIALVYGGGAVGLMGLLADTVLAAGGSVIGVMPTHLFPTEIAHPGLTELVEVESMHARKTKMFELADGFIALPGGFGTLEEVAEVTTWAQLGTHEKPIGLLNVDGYYDQLLAFFDRGVRDRLLREHNRALLTTATTPRDMLAQLRRYQARPRPQQIPLADT